MYKNLSYIHFTTEEILFDYDIIFYKKKTVVS